MNNVSLDNLPLEVLTRVLNNVSSPELLNIALAGKSVLRFALRALYHKLCVSTVHDYKKKNARENEYVVVSKPNCIRLLSYTLQNNEELAHLIGHFFVGPCASPELIRLIFALRTNATNLITFQSCFAYAAANFLDQESLLPHPFYDHCQILSPDDMLMKRNGRPRQLTICTDLSEFGFGINLNTDVLSSVKLLNLGSEQKSALRILDAIKLPISEKFRPEYLSIVHLHHSGSNAFDHINPDLSFPLVPKKINTLGLKTLCMSLECMEPLSRCECVTRFVGNAGQHAADTEDFDQLEHLKVSLVLDEGGLMPSMLLESIVLPLQYLILHLPLLKSLSFDTRATTFKMHTPEVGTEEELNLSCNGKIVRTLFLANEMLRCNGQTPSLSSLSFPDFFLGLVFHGDFFESPLHSCKCLGCKKLLIICADFFLPISDFDVGASYSTSFFFLIGMILDKLENERNLVHILSLETDFHQFKDGRLYCDSESLHQRLHNLGTCFCSLNLDIDTVIITYLVHQCRPVLEYVRLNIPEIEEITIHGLYFTRTCIGWKCLFDNDSYPVEILEATGLKMEGTKNRHGNPQDLLTLLETYGCLDLDFFDHGV